MTHDTIHQTVHHTSHITRHTVLDVDVAACPVNLHEHLAESFLAADKVLLQHLDGA